MTANLEARRRVLLRAYHRYLEADRIWRQAQNEALSWFPAGSRPSNSPFGQPGSPVRRLYDRRDRALARLMLVRLKLYEARQRPTRRLRVLALPPG